MKRIGGWILAALCIAACIYGYRYWLKGTKTAPLAVFFTEGEAALPEELETVRRQLAADGYRTQSVADPDALAAMADQAGVILWKPAASAVDHALLNTLQRAGAPVLLAGSVPGWVLRSGYDKLWCISASEADAGELLGQQAAQIFREGLAFDRDGDHLLDRAALSDGSETALAMLEAAYTECEHYGVYSADCAAAAGGDGLTEEASGEEMLPEASLPESAVEPSLGEQWASLTEPPEVIFCIGLEYAQQALETAGELGWLDGETPVRLAAIVENETAAQTLAENGSFCAVVYYDLAAEERALRQVAVNLMEHRAAAYGTALRQKDGLPCFDLPYRVAEVTLSTPEKSEEEP